jgi:hypothetical protein
VCGNTVRGCGALLLIGLAASCTNKTPTPPRPSFPASVDGEWLFSVSAGPSCGAELPFGYGGAPRGGGRAILTQTNNRFSGQLQIFGVPSGTIEGLVTGSAVQLNFKLDGKNQGVTSLGDEPCKVAGSGSAHTSVVQKGSSLTCYIFGENFTGEFACPYACKPPAQHYVMLTRGCSQNP